MLSGELGSVLGVLTSSSFGSSLTSAMKDNQTQGPSLRSTLLSSALGGRGHLWNGARNEIVTPGVISV